MVTGHDQLLTLERSGRSSVDVMTHDQFVTFARSALARAGVEASVDLQIDPSEEEDDAEAPRVSVVTEQPYEAWKALTRQSDPLLERSGPSSITERFYGVQVVIGSDDL